MPSVSLFKTSAESDESTRLAREWMRKQGLEAALPNPTITSGPDRLVRVHRSGRGRLGRRAGDAV